MYSGHLVFPSQVMTLVQCFCNTPATELFERCPEANRRSIQKLQEIFSHIAGAAGWGVLSTIMPRGLECQSPGELPGPC
jgi:hypothetical protein